MIFSGFSSLAIAILQKSTRGRYFAKVYKGALFCKSLQGGAILQKSTRGRYFAKVYKGAIANQSQS
ncbi:hypothetical protein IJ00_25885 [Calothrix sp. 336/3]|nr:hypothetical protein IJ00_25885 [Calothrix sp. 336/3]